ncbi:hypothetical protein CI109_100824 [Kwoniella shandongensis]|uniref:Uncharacterized protein n=1 Tax=Kwoniella shandongensis TaxID=1734106 RepID=A0A5M6BUT3_9TREE|nr:uncharacterized protein CI109_006913 [Kwoniella shandongensis]KAA5524759.1 hypothetical protein CI109_006913 [Kwoniella shandongensis]
MSSSQRGGNVHDPVLLDSSDDDAPRAGPSQPRQSSGSAVTRRVYTRSQRNTIVDLTQSDSGDDRLAPSRHTNSSPTIRRRGAPRTSQSSQASRRISMTDLPDAIDMDEIELNDGTNTYRGSARLTVVGTLKIEPEPIIETAPGSWGNPQVYQPPPAKEPEPIIETSVGSWGNPQVYEPPAETQAQAGPSTSTRATSTTGEDFQDALDLQTPVEETEVDPPITSAPSGGWADPIPYVPPIRNPTPPVPHQNSIQALSASPAPSPGPLRQPTPSPPPVAESALNPARYDPAPLTAESVLADPSNGSWLNPVPYVPSPPRTVDSQPEQPDGSWLHPVAFVPPPSLKRAMEAVSSPSKESTPGPVAKKRKGNSHQPESVVVETTDAFTEGAAQASSSALVDTPVEATRKAARPKWATSDTAEAVSASKAAVSVEVVSTTADGATESMEVDDVMAQTEQATLVPLPGIFTLEPVVDVSDAPRAEVAPPSTTLEPHRADSAPHSKFDTVSEVVSSVPETTIPQSLYATPLGDSEVGTMTTTETDIKPALQSELTTALPSYTARNGPLLPIEVDLTDDDLADLTSNEGDARPTAEVEVNNAPAEVVETRHLTPDVEIVSSRQASTAPSIEEITSMDGQTVGTLSRRLSKRVSERFSHGESSKGQALGSQARSKSDARHPVLSPDISEDSRKKSPSVEVVIPTRSRRLWRKLVELGGESEVEDILDGVHDSPPPSGPSLEYDGFTVHKTYSFRHRLTVKDDSSSSSSTSVPSKVDLVTQLHDFNYPDPPRVPERIGHANRILDTKLIDEWNKRRPNLTNNPSLHRAVFEAYMAQSTSLDEPQADEIKVVNDVDSEGAPPDFEFQYSNDMLYNPDVPDPELSLGCDCDGPCDPKAGDCSCVKRQEAYFYNLGMEGFAYDEHGHIKETSVSVWECSETCGCPPECMNRVIQRRRSKETKIELFKTRFKGWGVRARAPIPSGTFIGVYAGEMITEQESEMRGMNYAKLGRTYLFDCDGWQIANPPEGLEDIDARAAELAETCAQRARIAAEDFADPSYVYSAYSVDAFHYGFTRYFNHSCDPNLAITQAYVKDFHPERPILVIFARRPIRYGEELCISYKGLPDEEEMPLPSPEVKCNGRRGKKKNSKTSASAHITSKTKSKVAAKDQCMCGTARCDGRMFNYGD